MAEEKSPDEPFDPYAPPPPGQQYGQAPQGQPYGQAPQGQPYGQAPPGHGYYYPQGYATSYDPPPKKSTLPLWLGTLLGLALVAGAIWAGAAVGPDLFPWVAMGLLVVLVVLLVIPVTRRWGLGILIGVFLSIPIGLIIFAGVCIVILVRLNEGTG